MSAGLQDPLDVGPLRFRSRLFLPTHGTRLPQARYLPYLAARASQVAMVGVSASAGLVDLAFGPGGRLVGVDGVGSAGDFDAIAPDILAPGADDAFAWHQRELADQADVIHAGGALVTGQLVHLGAVKHLEDLQPAVSPSGRRDGYRREQPHRLDEDGVERLVLAFAAAGRRARDAGVDAIELHAAHGYLLHQFLAPAWNQRDDRWGGAPDRRAAFPLAVLAAVRHAVGDEVPIGVRIGLGGDVDLVEVAAAFEAAGVAYLSVSGGSYTGWGSGEEAYVAPESTGEGLNVAAAALVRAAVAVPVLVAGRITTIDAAAAIVGAGQADAVGMVRAFIAEPRLRTAPDPRPCIGANECHQPRRPVTCAVNPTAGREAHVALPSAQHGSGDRVVVVGGGPAGIEAAVGAAEAGCRVVLLERSGTLGGALVAQVGVRPELRRYVDWLQRRPGAVGVDVRLGVEAAIATVLDLEPDVVALATGSVERSLAPGGLVGSDVLAGSPAISGPVAVIGGLEDHLGPIVVALHLAGLGHEVVLVSETVVAGEGLEPSSRVAAHRRLRAAGVRTEPLRRVVAVDPGGVDTLDPLSGERGRVAALAVVDCSLRGSRDELLEGLRPALGRSVVLLGDALAPRRLVNATLEGHRFGIEQRLAPRPLSI